MLDEMNASMQLVSEAARIQSCEHAFAGSQPTADARFEQPCTTTRVSEDVPCKLVRDVFHKYNSEDEFDHGRLD